MLLSQVELLDYRNQGQCNRVLWFPAIDFCYLNAPPIKCGARYLFIGTFVNEIVNFAAKSIQGSDGTALIRWQKHEAIVKTGPAGSSLVLAILIWGHINISQLFSH